MFSFRLGIRTFSFIGWKVPGIRGKKSWASDFYEDFFAASYLNAL